MGRSSLAVDPQSHAMNIESRVVITCDVAAIPPASLDALRSRATDYLMLLALPAKRNRRAVRGNGKNV